MIKFDDNDYYKSIHYLYVILQLCTNGITDFMTVIVYTSLSVEEALVNDLLKIRKDSDLALKLNQSIFLQSVSIATIINYYIPYILKALDIGQKNDLLIYDDHKINIVDKGQKYLNIKNDKTLSKFTNSIQNQLRVSEKLSSQHKAPDILDFLERLGVDKL